MPEPLRIFISHKMPTDTPLAQEIGAKLALYAGNQIRVTHAGKFRYGENWRERIQEELEQAHILILLYTDPDEDWGFCLYECGFFRYSMAADQRKQLITFCRRGDQISEALKEFNAVVMGEDAIRKLLEDIYLRDPWKISPELSPEVLRATAADIANAFAGAQRVVQNFDLAMSMMFEFRLDEGTRAALGQNRVPAEAEISGTLNWQRLFGKGIDTGAWQWTELAKDWANSHVYEFLLAGMMDDALAARIPRGTFLRVDDSHDLYRMTLRRYERGLTDKYRFHFTAASMDLPYDLPAGPEEKVREVVLYHLLSLTWYFQRRVTDDLYERLQEVMATPRADAIRITDLYDAIGRELTQIFAHAIIRGVDNALVIQRALGARDEQVREFIAAFSQSQELCDRIFTDLRRGPESLADVARNLHQLTQRNCELYRKVAVAYASLSKGLKPPPAPWGIDLQVGKVSADQAG
ncbi:MAG: hypothetical protein ACKV2V_27925 [Blastocatellia bacterium]